MGQTKSQHRFFNNLVHFAFVGIRKSDEDYEILRLNTSAISLLKQSSLDTENLYESYVSGMPSLQRLVNLVIQDTEVAGEYLEALNSLFVKGTNKDLKLSQFIVEESGHRQVMALRSHRPEGILSNLNPVGSYSGESALYIDIFTVPQQERKSGYGFQGVFTIVNDRRRLYLKNKRESELNVFHSLLVDMKNRAPAALSRIVRNEELSPIAESSILQTKVYLEAIIDKASSTLELFSLYRSTERPLQTTPVSLVEDRIKSWLSNPEIQQLATITLSFEESLRKWDSFLVPEFAEYAISELVHNGIKAYESKDVRISEREVSVTLSSVELRGSNALKVSVTSNGQFISDKKILRFAGVRPINSSSSTGLGLYFLNTLLELLKSDLPRLNQNRQFDLYSDSNTGVTVEFFYNLIPSK